MPGKRISKAANLSDAGLLHRAVLLAGEEREATVELVAHLAEIDTRKLYLSEGYGSLFAYCTGPERLETGHDGAVPAFHGSGRWVGSSAGALLFRGVWKLVPRRVSTGFPQAFHAGAATGPLINLGVNVYPILHHRHTRVRIVRLLTLDSGRRADPPTPG